MAERRDDLKIFITNHFNMILQNLDDLMFLLLIYIALEAAPLEVSGGILIDGGLNLYFSFKKEKTRG